MANILSIIMQGFLLTERSILIALLGSYFIYLGYTGYDLTKRLDDDKHEMTFIILGIIGVITNLYSLYIFFSA